MPDVALFYLARTAEGPEPICRFLRSLREFAFGIPYRFIIINKGDNDSIVGDALKQNGPIENPDVVKVPDIGLDVDTYWRIGRKYQADYSVFLNTFSEPLVRNWGALMMSHAAANHLLGATGNWESFAGRTLCLKQQGATNLGLLRRLVAHNLSGLWWPRFPNPAIRTNAFVVPRTLLNSAKPASGTKRSAYRFESGRGGLSHRFRMQGGRLLVIGRDGRAYAETEWPKSKTFRSRDQENLLVSDNRTREYANASPERRLELVTISWGRDER